MPKVPSTVTMSKIGAGAVWLILVAGFVIPWLPLNNRHQDIDIKSGRIRHRQVILGICTSERVADSPISRELQLGDVHADWRQVTTNSLLVDTSPHYVFHSATHQTRELEMIWRLAPFTRDARQRACQEVLKLWQTGQRDDAADAYIDALSALTIDRDASEPRLTIEDLPDA